jgi:hypothetical protein
MKADSFATLALTAALALGLTACGSSGPHGNSGEPYKIMHLGEHFETPEGNVFVIRVQDDFKLIRCIPEGPIAGCYEDLLSVPEHGLAYGEWVSVQSVPGLRLAFLSPLELAVRMEDGSAQ